MPIEIDITENAVFKFGAGRGEARGEMKGEAKVLTRLLERWFGPLAESIRTRIAAADIEALDSWIDRLDSSASLDTVFAH